jgi:hypothetical protein
MRISERMGLVYTALFLTVSVAVITQNSDTLMASFRGESAVRPVDDLFTVRPGRDQRLFVLSNDVHAQNVPAGAVRLASAPDCGKVEKAGGSFVYSQSIACSGQQVFHYCIATGDTCDRAKVVLKLEDTRPAVDSIAEGPVVETPGFSRQVDINGRDLEITNVRLGRTAPGEQTGRPVANPKLARVAAGDPPTLRPAPIEGATDVRAAFDIDELTPRPRPRADTTGVDVAANGQTASDATPATGPRDLVLPTLPGSAALPLSHGPALAIRLAGLDLDHRRPTLVAVDDRSPFGTSCEPALTGKVLDDGMVELVASMPCHPNTRVEIFHGKLRFAEVTGHSGGLRVVVPALDRAARFLVRVPGERPLQVALEVPALAQIQRMAIQWDGPAEFDLHAFEFGAAPGSAGHVWAGRMRTPDQAARSGGGYMTALGSDAVENPVRVRVYSYPKAAVAQDGMIELLVTAAPDPAECGTAATILSHQSAGGHLVGSAGYRIKLPACGTTAETIVLKNALGDMIIAAR